MGWRILNTRATVRDNHVHMLLTFLALFYLQPLLLRYSVLSNMTSLTSNSIVQAIFN